MTIKSRNTFSGDGGDVPITKTKTADESPSTIVLFEHKVIWIVETLVTGTVDLIVGLVKFANFLILEFFVLITLLGLALGWILARDLFLWMCPELRYMTIPIVILINVITNVFIVLWDAVVFLSLGIQKSVNGIISAIDSLGAHIGHFNLPFTNKYLKFETITYSEYDSVLRALPPICKKYNTAESVFRFILRTTLHGYTCPITRYFWPIRWFYNILSSILAYWTYYGSAVPDPNGHNENCDTMETVTSYDYICAGMGGGYV